MPIAIAQADPEDANQIPHEPAPNTTGVTQMSGHYGYNLRNKAADNKKRKTPISPARKMAIEDDA